MLIENVEYDVLLERFKKILRQGGLKYTINLTMII